MDQQTTINAHNNGSTIHQRSISDFVYLNVEGHTTTDVCSYLRLEVLPFSSLRNVDDDGTNVCYPIG
ncbi:hypothetical protein ACSQ67_014818 [Phaseolus vulgaris]